MSNLDRGAAAPRREGRAVACALTAVAMWSTVATAFKLGLMTMRPVQLLALASVFSLFVFTAAWGILRPRPARRRDLWKAAGLGLANPLAYYLILFEAYDRLPAQIAQPINYTWALVLAMLAVPLLRQRLSGRTLAGIAVSYIGVTVLVTQGQALHVNRLDGAGVLFALASTVVWAGYWIMAARLPLHPTQQLLPAFAVGTPCVLAACALSVGLPPLTHRNFVFGMWVGMFEMGLAFLAWNRGMTLTRNAGRLSQLIFLAPFLSLMLIDRVLGETTHATAWAGLALIVAGLMLGQRAQAP